VSVYRETIRVPPQVNVDSAEIAVEKIREYGMARFRPDFDQVMIEMEIDDNDLEGPDLWGLRDALGDLKVELDALGFDWSPRRENVAGPAVDHGTIG
jgi:hypothetical protein